MCRACDVMDVLRRASYPPQLRIIVIAHDAYISSMTVRTRSRPVSWRILFTSMRVCIRVADVPSAVRALAKSEKGIDNLIDIDFVPASDRRMPSAHSSQSLTSKQSKLTISSACLARQLNSHSS